MGVTGGAGSRGLGRLFEDLGGLAWRRPGVFLLAMTGAGFVTGRVLHSRSGHDEEASHGEADVGRGLDPAALEALSRRMWPGDAGDRRVRTPGHDQPGAPRS